MFGLLRTISGLTASHSVTVKSSKLARNPAPRRWRFSMLNECPVMGTSTRVTVWPYDTWNVNRSFSQRPYCQGLRGGGLGAACRPEISYFRLYRAVLPLCAGERERILGGHS